MQTKKLKKTYCVICEKTVYSDNPCKHDIPKIAETPFLSYAREMREKYKKELAIMKIENPEGYKKFMNEGFHVPKEHKYPCVQCGETMRLCVDGAHAYCKNPKCPNYNLLQIVE